MGRTPFPQGSFGQSARPAAGARNKPKIGTGLGMCGAESYLREEAYRLDRLREGEKVIELPAIQAVFRAMGLSA